MQAWDEERDFPRARRGRPGDLAGSTPVALAAVFDLEATVRHVDTVFERLSALARKEEPVHV